MTGCHRNHHLHCIIALHLKWLTDQLQKYDKGNPCKPFVAIGQRVIPSNSNAENPGLLDERRVEVRVSESCLWCL